MDGPWKVYFRIGAKSIEETVIFLSNETSTKSIWYFHPNGVKAGPHVHGLLWNHATTAETFRNKIKKYFNLTNKTDYGLSNKYERGTLMTEETCHGYVTYMSKGKYDPILMKDYDIEYANVRKSEWKEPRSVHISGDLEVVVHGEVKTKRITMFALANEAEDMYLDKYPNTDLMEPLKVKELEQCVLAVCRKYSKACPPRTCADLMGDICSRLAPNHYHSQVKRYLGLIPGINLYT